MARNGGFEIGRLSFDPQSGELIAPAITCRLEPKAAAVLTLLCASPDEVVLRQVLLDGCWGAGEGSDEALNQAVAQIRRALEELGESSGLIETFARRGYRLRVRHDAVVAPPPAPVITRSQRPRRALIMTLAAALTLALLAAWIANPHGPRHFIRHSLGLGPGGATH